MANFEVGADDWWGTGSVALLAQGPAGIDQEAFFGTWPVLCLEGC